MELTLDAIRKSGAQTVQRDSGDVSVRDLPLLLVVNTNAWLNSRSGLPRKGSPSRSDRALRVSYNAGSCAE